MRILKCKRLLKLRLAGSTRWCRGWGRGSGSGSGTLSHFEAHLHELHVLRQLRGLCLIPLRMFLGQSQLAGTHDHQKVVHRQALDRTGLYAPFYMIGRSEREQIQCSEGTTGLWLLRCERAAVILSWKIRNIAREAL